MHTCRSGVEQENSIEEALHIEVEGGGGGGGGCRKEEQSSARVSEFKYLESILHGVWRCMQEL